MGEELREIGTEAKFYGYLIGLWIDETTDYDAPTPRGMYARFEYSGTVTEWRVPDWELFSCLTPHLIANARMRDEHGEHGYDKVWIEKQPEGWSVDLP